MQQEHNIPRAQTGSATRFSQHSVANLHGGSASTFPDEAWPKQTHGRVRMAGASDSATGPAASPSPGADSDESLVDARKIGRIDVHSHYLPEKYIAALEQAGHSKPAGMPGIPKWSVSEHIAMMDRLNIAAAVISVSSPGIHFGNDAAACGLARYVNDEGAAAVHAHPTRFGLFASLPLPDIDGSLKEIEYAYDTLKVDGITLESNHHGVYLGDRRLDPVFEELNRRHAKLFLHPNSPHCPCCQDPGALPPIGYPFPMIEFMFETTRAIFNLILSGTLARFPNVQLIVPHAGATISILADRVAGLSPALGLPFPLDVEKFYKTLNGFYYDLAGFPLPRQLGPLLQIADPKRIVYGSDWPYTPEPLAAKLNQQLNETTLLSPQMRKDFLRENALSLFPQFR